MTENAKARNISYGGYNSAPSLSAQRGPSKSPMATPKLASSRPPPLPSTISPETPSRRPPGASATPVSSEPIKDRAAANRRRSLSPLPSGHPQKAAPVAASGTTARSKISASPRRGAEPIRSGPSASTNPPVPSEKPRAQSSSRPSTVSKAEGGQVSRESKAVRPLRQDQVSAPPTAGPSVPSSPLVPAPPPTDSPSPSNQPAAESKKGRTSRAEPAPPPNAAASEAPSQPTAPAESKKGRPARTEPAADLGRASLRRHGRASPFDSHRRGSGAPSLTRKKSSGVFLAGGGSGGHYDDLAIPLVPLTPFVLENARFLGEKAALIEGVTGKVLSYSELERCVRVAASSLLQRGYVKGSVFGFVSPCSPEYAIAFHAAALIGGVVTAINHLAHIDEIIGHIKETEITCLFASDGSVDKAIDAANRCSVSEVIVFGNAPGAVAFADLLKDPGGRSTSSLSMDLSLLDRDVDVPLKDIQTEVDLMHDGLLNVSWQGGFGSSSRATFTHHNLVASVCQILEVERLDADDITVALPGMFEPFSIVAVVCLALFIGSTVITTSCYDLETFLQLVETYQSTYLNVVPPILLSLAKSPTVDRFLAPLSGLRLLGCGASTVPELFQRLCSVRLGSRVKIKQSYGLPETILTHHCPKKIKFGSAGVCLPNTRCRIVDPKTKAEVPTNQVGEIWVAGPQLVSKRGAGFSSVDRNGFFHTGDFGHVDDEGYLFLDEHRSDVIKYDGYIQVSLQEIEKVLLSHPGVSDACVIPVQDEEHGEVAKAVVVPNRAYNKFPHGIEGDIFAWLQATEPAPERRPSCTQGSGSADADGEASTPSHTHKGPMSPKQSSSPSDWDRDAGTSQYPRQKSFRDRDRERDRGQGRDLNLLEELAKEIKQYVAGRLSQYKHVQVIEFTERLPKSPSGRVPREKLIEREREGGSDEENSYPVF